MKDPLEKLAERLDQLAGMKNVQIDNANSGIIFPNDVKLSGTPEEAINQARAEAMKKNMPFEEPQQEVEQKDIDDSSKRYTDELVQKMIDDILRG